MRILVAANCYNELPYIPYMVEYYRNQGCELLINDNYSTDGTYEWLMENRIPTVRTDTNESFLLQKLNLELTKAVQILKPDWVLYCGIDIYYFFPKGIKEEIMIAESKNCNLIEVNHCTAYNTGEDFQLPFYKNYFYVSLGRRLQMVAKFDNTLSFGPDALRVQSKRVHFSNGLLINYGMCKPPQEREETFNRRKKAWELGESKGHGVHYKPAHDKNWLWEKEKLLDVRKTNLFNLFK